jgi:hypothetical protein
VNNMLWNERRTRLEMSWSMRAMAGCICELVGGKMGPAGVGGDTAKGR